MAVLCSDDASLRATPASSECHAEFRLHFDGRICAIWSRGLDRTVGDVRDLCNVPDLDYFRSK